MTGVGDFRTAAGVAALAALHLRKDWLTPLQEHVQVAGEPAGRSISVSVAQGGNVFLKLKGLIP